MSILDLQHFLFRSQQIMLLFVSQFFLLVLCNLCGSMLLLGLGLGRQDSDGAIRPPVDDLETC